MKLFFLNQQSYWLLVASSTCASTEVLNSSEAIVLTSNFWANTGQNF